MEDHAVSATLLAGAVRPPSTSAPRRKAKAKASNKATASKHAIVLAPHANSTQRVQSKLYNLTLDVQNLHQQIASLTTYRSILYARALVTQYDLDVSILRKVNQYFSVFRRGFRPADRRPADRRPASVIHAIADEDLSIGTTGFGRDMLLEQWRRYTQYFGMRRCDVPAPEILPGSRSDDDEEGDPREHEQITVRAALTFQGSFTPTALAIVFPAVLKDADLTQQLLGKSFSADAVFHLHFDKTTGLLVRHDVETDFFAVLATALGDPVRAAEILQVVGVAEESMLVDPEDAEEEKMDSATRTRLEPVERVVQSKRPRVVVILEDESEGNETRTVETPTEPDAEPTGVDARHTLDFLLS